MKIITDTPGQLTVKLVKRPGWLILGLALLAVGLAIIIWVKPQPLAPVKADILSMLRQQAEDPRLEPDYQPPSVGGVSLDLVGYTVGALFSGGRWLFLLGVASLLAGGTMALSPAGRSRKVSFSASPGQVSLTRPGWFFRSRTESYPFRNIAEARVERNPTFTGPAETCYRVCLVISHSEGTPLSPNFVSYKTVVPFSRYRYDYHTCQKVVDRIELALNRPQAGR
jgi:hypothetical protein